MKDEGDYSYAMSEICGDGFLMIDDAARFLDPVFSSDVSIAMTSARLATADIIATAKNEDTFAKDECETYRTIMRRGTANWYEFIPPYYRLNALSTVFVQNPRARLDVLKLLQGHLYEEQKQPILIEIARIVKDVENRPNHP
jgi:flavin-dependent dehydrogenase